MSARPHGKQLTDTPSAQAGRGLTCVKSLPSLEDAYKTTEELLAPGCTLRKLPSGCVGQSLGSATKTCGTLALHWADIQDSVAGAMRKIKHQSGDSCGAPQMLHTEVSRGGLPASL